MSHDMAVQGLKLSMTLIKCSAVVWLLILLPLSTAPLQGLVVAKMLIFALSPPW